MEDNRERIGRAHLEQTGRQLEDQICKTNTRQLGDKWETTSERHLGNNGVTNGKHLETIGRPIRGDK